MNHTAEPWLVLDEFFVVATPSLHLMAQHGYTVKALDLAVAEVLSPDLISGEEAEANAARIVACVNACAGIDDADLEYLQRGDVRQLVKQLKQQWGDA